MTVRNNKSDASSMAFTYKRCKYLDRSSLPGTVAAVFRVAQWTPLKLLESEILFTVGESIRLSFGRKLCGQWDTGDKNIKRHVFQSIVYSSQTLYVLPPKIALGKCPERCPTGHSCLRPPPPPGRGLRGGLPCDGDR